MRRATISKRRPVKRLEWTVASPGTAQWESFRLSFCSLPSLPIRFFSFSGLLFYFSVFAIYLLCLCDKKACAFRLTFKQQQPSRKEKANLGVKTIFSDPSQ